MQRTNVTIDPAEWLRSAPNPLPPDKVSEVLASFSRPPTVFKFKGPGTLLRATGKDSSENQANAYGGAYWVDAEEMQKIDANLSMFVGWLSAKELARTAIARYRGGTAICRDWNDLSEFHKMEVPPAETFVGLAGPVKPQPAYSHMDAKNRNTPTLSGGFDQIFLKVRNPFWIVQCAPF